MIDPPPDRFVCLSCGFRWEQDPHPVWSWDGRYLVGYSRAATNGKPDVYGACPQCDGCYARWMNYQGREPGPDGPG